jgi:peptidoglycan/LPS O-acetylase OafA/YrhL
VYQSLQLCRAVAALLVVLFHLGGAIGSDKYFNLPSLAQALTFGHSGVAFFFVLSGFIITHVHGRDVGQPGRLSSYLRKRAARIYPPFLIVFGVVFAAGMASASLRAALPTDPLVVLKALLLLPQDIARVGGTGAPVLIVAWSLHYELLFYALFALAIVHRTAALVVVVALALHAMSCWFGQTCNFPRSFFASYWMLLFLMGVAVARLARRPASARVATGLATAGVIGFALVAAVEVGAPLEAGGAVYIAYGLCSSLIVLGLVQAENAGAIAWRHPAVAALGDSSYALYLVHYPLISLVCKLSLAIGLKGLPGAALAFVATLTLCVLAGHLFHRRVERPLLRLLNRPRPSVPAKPAAGAN